MADIPLKYALPFIALAALPLVYVTAGPLVAALSPTSQMANHYTEKEADDTVAACSAMKGRLDALTTAQVDTTDCTVDFSTSTALLAVLLLRNERGEKLTKSYIGHIERIDKGKWDATDVAQGVAPRPSGTLFNYDSALAASGACGTIAIDLVAKFPMLLWGKDEKDCEVNFDGKTSATVTLSFMTNETPSRLRKYAGRVERNKNTILGWVTTAMAKND